MDGHGLADALMGMGIQQYKTDVGFRTLMESVNEDLYVIPKYQRKYRWTREQVVGLVRSLICGLPIPPIYTCRNAENQLEILDGQQRIMSLFFYYIGHYLDKKRDSSIDFSEIQITDGSFRDALIEQFALEELHIQIKGKKGELFNVDYGTLPVEIKRRVDYTTITIIEIKIDDTTQRSEILRQIFANLNKDGPQLSRQEQRNGIYTCKFYDMLQDYNKHNARWRKIWGREDAKERDTETLLRLCALKKYVRVKRQGGTRFDLLVEGYTSSYAEMLDRFSEEAMGFDEKQRAEYRESLDRFLGLFTVDRTQSTKVALMESLYIVHEKMGVDKPITPEIYDRILKDKRYKAHARQGTVKMKSMNERWKAVYEIWIGDDKGGR